MTVVAGATDTGEPAHTLDREHALRTGCRLHHRLDDFVDFVAPVPSLGWRSPFTCRKACRKKSRSTCCWPTLRSSSAIRRLATDRSSIAVGGGSASFVRRSPIG